MPTVVRPATPADIPALCRMKTSLLALEDSLRVATASEEDWRRDGFGPNAKFNALIAEVDGAAAGKRGFPGWDGSALFLHDLYVEELHRGRGCARALMAALAAQAQPRTPPSSSLRWMPAIARGNSIGAWALPMSAIA
jgi:GNAT superfamily N-acetyltransferase